MANIPVEKTESGAAWLPWLLGLLALAVIGFFIFQAMDDPDTVEVAETEVVEATPAVVATDVVDDAVETDVVAMDMSNLYVTRVTGDRTFYVSPSADDASNETLVILDQNMSPGAPGIEGQVDINAGQIVNLSGGTMTTLDGMDFSSGYEDGDRTMLEGMDAMTSVITIDGGDVNIMEADMENVEVE